MTDIIVVGCGGTGSHYIKELGRLLYGMKAGDRVRLILVDGDSVEEKNLVRQQCHKFKRKSLDFLFFCH